ncbi:hypothetical protein HY031_00115 [Candidatus Gottesmanbacteria bacterium]|nr:hypothetical protein [Candidatus Gottesmanbacteria bacterium]
MQTPNIPVFVHEVTEMGVMRATLMRFFRLSFFDQIYLISTNLFNLPKLVMKDFNEGMLFVIEMEILHAGKHASKSVILTNQVADMAACFRNPKIFLGFLKLSKKYSFVPSVKTNNYRLVKDFLDQNSIHIKIVN